MEVKLINDIYIMIPVDISNYKKTLEQIIIPEYMSAYLEKMKINSEYECDKKISKTLNREYLGIFQFANMDDSYEKLLCQVDVDLILTIHKNTNLGLLSLFFKNNISDITQLEDQMSSKHLYIIIDDVKVEICTFISEQFGLYQCGDEKILICLNQKPKTELELCYILAAESINSVHIDYKINSNEIMEAARNNLAEYHFYESYASDTCLVYISDKITENYINNIDIEAAIIFICEIVVLQNSAISRTNQRIVDELTTNINISLKTIEKMYVEFGRTIILWDKNIFNYTLAQKLANKIYSSFGNEELLNDYYRNQNYIEHIIELRSTLNSDREGKLLNVLAFILSISQLIQIVGSVVGFIKTCDFKILIFGGIGVSSTTLLIIFISILQKHLSAKIRNK